ncbi:MAG TPA: ATP-binding protein, partial [Limnobacter sp.]|uniref:sensor histidine kinase n=1 Tax=Limnobacter sp. TaxID=2003368 RepID=UPI002E34A598
NEISSNQAEMTRLREQIAQLAQSTDQETLRQLTENQQLIEQLNWLSGTIAHDFRAPLRAIDAYSFFLDDELGDSAPAEAKSSLGEIRRNGKRLGVLIDGLIDFLRLSTCPLNRMTYDLGDAARELLSMDFRGSPVQIDSNFHFPVKFDPDLGLRMMKELIDNAIKFSSVVEQPKIVIRKAGDFELEIIDNGVGFAAEHSDKLFRLFHRMHGNDEFEGEGIGLCIAQRIADRHGATLGLHRVGNLTVASLRFTPL